MRSDHKISERELQYLFAEAKRKPLYGLRKAIKYIATFFIVFGVVYTIINYAAFSKQLTYWYVSDVKNIAPGNGANQTVVSIKNKNDERQISSRPPNIAENNIFIPSINLTAPVAWNIANNEDSIQKALQRGVVQIADTAHPGEVGNIFITGHSSNYFWAPGGYKSVFALLNKLVAGDVVYIKYNSIIYAYKIGSARIVRPDDLSAMNQSKDSVLTLVTCSPVGTSINRLVIKAMQISPDPKLNKANSSKNLDSTPSGYR